MIQKTFQRRRHMQKFFTFFYGLLILPAFSVLHRPDQYILWRVFHVNKFQDLDIIALPLQILRPQRICYKSRHPFPDQPVFQHRSKHIALNLPVQLMLTAGHRQNDFRIPSHSFCKSEIRSRVTGMER